MDNTEPLINKPKSVPFFLRVVAILILVTGVTGFLFYSIAMGYYFVGRNFLYDIQYKGFTGSAYYFILFLQMVLNAGLAISAIMLLKLKLSGLYIFTISYLIFALLSYFLQDNYGWTVPVIGFVILIVIFLHKRKLIN
jgi:hypothetical protein